MTYMANEENPSKKKYLVPLVVLLLCGVAMTGAAFAYSATLEGGSEPVPVDALKLTFTSTDESGHYKFKCAEGETLTPIAYKSLTKYDDANKKWVTTYGLDASPEGGYAYKFNVTGDKAFRVTECTVTVYKSTDNGTTYTEVESGISANADAFETDLATTQDVTFTVTVTADEKCTISAEDYAKIKYRFDVVVDGTTEEA